MYCCFVIFRESVYFTLYISILWTFIYRTSTMNPWYHINLFYLILVLFILLLCCICCTYEPFWSVISTHCKRELMFIVLLYRIEIFFLFSLLMLVFHQHLPKTTKTKNKKQNKTKQQKQTNRKNQLMYHGITCEHPKMNKSLPDLQDHATCC